MYAKIRKDKINKLPDFFNEGVLYKIVNFRGKGVNVLVPISSKENKVCFLYYNNIIIEER